MSAFARLPHLMTVAEFLDWEAPLPGGYELIDGNPRAMNPPSDRHALIHGEVARVIGGHLAEHRPDCRLAIGSGLHPNDYNYRVPDLVIACGGRMLLDPVLVIEILSPSNEADTWANIAAYQSIGSVEEILVLASTEVRGVLLSRVPTAPWPQTTYVAGDTVVIPSIGLRAPLAAFYRTV